MCAIARPTSPVRWTSGPTGACPSPARLEELTTHPTALAVAVGAERRPGEGQPARLRRGAAIAGIAAAVALGTLLAPAVPDRPAQHRRSRLRRGGAPVGARYSALRIDGLGRPPPGPARGLSPGGRDRAGSPMVRVLAMVVAGGGHGGSWCRRLGAGRTACRGPRRRSLRPALARSPPGGLHRQRRAPGHRVQRIGRGRGRLVDAPRTMAACSSSPACWPRSGP